VQHFDLIIVGAGSGNTIPGPDHAGWNIAIIEKDTFGGTCLNRGCIPSKMLIHAADVAETIHTAAPLGITARVEGLDWDRITGRVWQRIDPLAAAGEQGRQSQPHTTVFKGAARFVGEKTLEVNGQRLTAPRVILAAGSRPAIPAIPGLEQVVYHTSDTIMRLPRQPPRMAILGGGYIGAELGHFFGALGTEITLIHRGDRLLPREDEEISQRFTDLYARRFTVFLHTQVQRVRQQADTITLDLPVAGRLQQVTCDVLLLAVGRIPNSDLLDVARAGIAVDAQGRVVTNVYHETNVPGIWALGDITSPHQLKHAANAEARTVAYNVAHPTTPRRRNDFAMPHAVFASPQVASVGLTEQQAQAQGGPYVVGKRAYSATAYGWAIEDTESFVKLLAHAATRQVLGAHIIGPHAALLLQPLVNAMRFGETVDQLAHDTFYRYSGLLLEI
jgi:mycothione reductase